MSPVDHVGTSVYRAGIRLCPPAFQREFGPQMLLDFEEARGDAGIAGPSRTKLRFHARMAIDLARTLVGQWLKTGLPAIAVLAMGATTVVMLLVSKAAQYVQFTVPDSDADPEVLTLMLLSTVLIVVLVLAVLFAQWAAHPRLRRQPRLRRR